MRILDRYVLRQFLLLFLLFVVCATGLFILGDLVENIGAYQDRGIPSGLMLRGFLYSVPNFALYSLPIAALIATMFTVNAMSRHSEVAAAKAGGISFYRVFAMIPVLGVLLTAGGLWLSDIVPVTNRLKAEAHGERRMSRTNRPDFVYRDDLGRAFSIRRLDVGRGLISGLIMEREGDEPRVGTVHVVAERAVYDEGAWTLENGYMRFFSDEIERTFRFATNRPRDFTETPEQLLAQPKDPDEMTYQELTRFIEISERSGGRPLELMVERAEKLAIPAATLIIVLFAMPLANAAPRAGAAFGVGVSLAITMVYMILFRVAGAAGASGAVDPTLAAWMPNALFGAGAVYLLARVRT